MTLWDDVLAHRGWGRWPAEEVVRSVTRLATAAARPLVVLEVGCGPGPQLWYLEHEGHRAVGIDLSFVGLSQAASRLAQEGCAARLAVADAARLPFHSAAFDLVLDVEAFAHNHEDVSSQLWAEAARVLRPGGHLLSVGFTCNTYGASAGPRPGTRTVVAVADGPLAGYGTVSLVDEQAATALAAAAGFELVDVQTRSRTTGPARWPIEEQVTLARRPAEQRPGDR